MDCCNYMQHRQSYYGSQYYESNPAYHHDFQQHQYASDMQQYGAPNWGFAASCSDYVYNPKEARIRKALRDRERSIVNSSTARSRRSNWSRQSPVPQMPPIAHGDPHMNMPSKEFRSVIRHELEHGFLHSNSGYIYPSQQYLFAPQSEYMSYINAIPSTNWPGNTSYNMPNHHNNSNTNNNNMVQQQLWNQYQADRVRSQQNQGYVPQQPDYQVEQQQQQHMASSSSVGVGVQHEQHAAALAKSRIHQNMENAASDVDRYLNMPNGAMRTSSPMPRNHHMQLDQMRNNSTVPVDDGPQELTSSSSSSNNMNLSNVGCSSVPEVEVETPINLDNSDNAESGFGAGNGSSMQLFHDDDVQPSMNPQETRKTTNLIGHDVDDDDSKGTKNKNPLPDFNQAFGSTERGRFQSPPDPRLGPEKEYLDFFHDHFTIKTEQYTKWAETANNTYNNNNNNTNQNQNHQFNISF